MKAAARRISKSKSVNRINEKTNCEKIGSGKTKRKSPRKRNKEAATETKKKLINNRGIEMQKQQVCSFLFSRL